MAWLFSYGTLRQPEVQRALFGRLLESHEDILPGYTLASITIADPQVIALSGSAEHPILRISDDPEDVVFGMALNVSEGDLARADVYEDPAYRRVLASLRSGRRAYGYVERAG